MRSIDVGNWIETSGMNWISTYIDADFFLDSSKPHQQFFYVSFYIW